MTTKLGSLKMCRNWSSKWLKGTSEREGHKKSRSHQLWGRNLVARRLWCCRNPKVESGGARLDLWRLAGVGSWRTSFVFLFWLHWVACGILVSWQEMEPTSSAVEAQILKHRTTWEVPWSGSLIAAKSCDFLPVSLARMIWVEDKFEGSYLEVGIPIGSFMKVQERERREQN